MSRLTTFNRLFILFYLGLLIFIIWKVPHEQSKEKETKAVHAEMSVNGKGDSF